MPHCWKSHVMAHIVKHLSYFSNKPKTRIRGIVFPVCHSWWLLPCLWSSSVCKEVRWQYRWQCVNRLYLCGLSLASSLLATNTVGDGLFDKRENGTVNKKHCIHLWHACAWLFGWPFTPCNSSYSRACPLHYLGSVPSYSFGVISVLLQNM